MKSFNDDWIGLSELFELTDYLSIGKTDDYLSHVLSNGNVLQWGGEYIPARNKEDFHKVFDRHWKKYLKKNPQSYKETFIEITIKELNILLKTIEDNLNFESYSKHPQYIQCQDYILFLKEYKESMNPKTFLTSLNPDQLKKLRGELIEKDIIYNSISEDEFIYIFSDKPITDSMKPIKLKFTWGAKSFVRTFLTMLMPGQPLEKKQIRACFIDSGGRPVELAKPKEDSKYIGELENILKEL